MLLQVLRRDKLLLIPADGEASEARFRWHRPIQATVEVGGPFNRLPRWPFQVAAVARRTGEIGRTLRQLAAGRPRG